MTVRKEEHNSPATTHRKGFTRPVTRLFIRPFQQFFRLEAASGILLLVAAILALIAANSPLAALYFHLFETHLYVGIGAFSLDKPLHLWINDGLMAVFFLVVGLEIKRELLGGELSSPRKALLPIAAALGGMLAPASIYVLLNASGDGLSGWGIPMATDIAFAVGVLALLGSRIPLALKVFLTAVAIVDDLGAILVIALFYTSSISIPHLLGAGIVLLALVVLGRMGIRTLVPFLLLGVFLWGFFLASGIHATIAGVLLAMTIPSSTTADSASSPLVQLEHTLHPWVAFFIMPVFAFANAGVSLSGSLLDTLANPISQGILLGLVVGKQVGVFGGAWLIVRAGLSTIPSDVSWRQLYGVSLLCGIGFTMSLFIATLAFGENPGNLDVAKTGILMASLLAGLAGWFILSKAAKRPSPEHAPAMDPLSSGVPPVASP